ncbi:SRPBCC family protein [Demequina capsici]|uniref:SRPBCC family protein n=1 Tax=Demequina capsici TaxID=3075620 RepID=A0AA96FFR6_9MICO|nr:MULTISPECIES: SRPBCC family protein [unclassified Demequina]WNM25899.1 SRPBCC family protein [Demequina sp. OYTSA14]WNM28795.1 SRPBCC family protein [Demequina sp. PMTSA13]
MPSASRTVEISAPISAVYAFFTDPANDPKWRGGVKEMLLDGQPRVGAVVRRVVAGPGGRSIDANVEITELTAPTRYASKTVTGPVRPVGIYSFVSAGDRTRVTFSLDVEVSGLKKLFMGGPVQKSMDGEMAALDKAKELLES